jgi:hypothetical protein
LFLWLIAWVPGAIAGLITAQIQALGFYAGGNIHEQFGLLLPFILKRFAYL